MADVSNMMQSPPVREPSTLAVAARLLRQSAFGEYGQICFGLFLLLAGELVSLLQPWPLKIVLDSVIGPQSSPWRLDALAGVFNSGHPKMALLVLLCVGLLLVDLIMGVLMVISTYVLVAIGLRMVFKLRCRLFAHVQKLSLRFHDTTTVGDSLYRVTWDSYCVQSVFNSGLIPAITSGAKLAGIAVIMLFCDWSVALVTLGVSAPLMLLIRFMDKPMTEHSMRVHERESEISTRVQETLSGIRAVQAFGQEMRESERFRLHAESSLRANLRLTVIQTLSQALVGLLLAAGTSAIVLIGAWRVLQHRLTAGDVVLIVSYVAMLFKPLETLAYTAANVQGAVAGGRRVFKILDAQPDVRDAPGAADLPGRASGTIRFDGIRFAYREGEDVLRDVTVDIPAGATYALVGPSGAGKTTLVSLVMRFYDPASGRILLDDRDLRKLTLRSLRSNIALVLQDPVLFCSSIGENIAYGRPTATHQQIESAAKSAGAHEFITVLPEGYDTQIGERGASLSGGQRQRIAIARAFLKDAPVLIMDEPTSALDAESEGQLLAAMQRLKEGRTTLIIAHRLSTIRAADRILVMKDGRIVESGNHEQLLAQNGLYAHLHEVQFGSSASVSAPT